MAVLGNFYHRNIFINNSKVILRCVDKYYDSKQNKEINKMIILTTITVAPGTRFEVPCSSIGMAKNFIRSTIKEYGLDNTIGFRITDSSTGQVLLSFKQLLAA